VRRTARAAAQVAAADSLAREIRHAVEKQRSAGQKVCSLRVAWGCSGECTYCAIRLATGPLCSKPLADVLGEFDEALGEGFTRFEVIAGDVGWRGQDIGDTRALLRSIRFDRVDAYPYAGRPRTAAHSLARQVPAQVISDRCTLLRREFPTVIADYS
jgi:tRNA A37 methylthiotransferase MiaB